MRECRANKTLKYTVMFNLWSALSNLNLTAGYEYQRIVNESFGLSASGFLTDYIGSNNIGTASDFNKAGKIIGSSNKSGERLISFFWSSSLQPQLHCFSQCYRALRWFIKICRR